LEFISKDGQESSANIETAGFGHDFSRIPIHPKAEDNRSALIRGKDPQKGKVPKKAGAPAPAPAAAKKTAGVESFVVRWTENSESGPTKANLRLDFWAKFKKDATHDPALAEFRQNAAFDFKIIAGPNKGFGSTHPMQDDGYSRTDDLAGNTIQDANFASNDNPGTANGITIDKNDVIDFTFTAEQMIVDTGSGDDWNGYKEIAKRGPHTATIKGKHPRKYEGVPINFS
jgi:hypothetical protein